MTLAMIPSEDQEQALYFHWLEYVMINGKPLRDHVHHVPNGGDRNPVVAAKLKAQGVTPGVPDISVEVPSGRFHGLRIEMKRRGGRASDAQRTKIILLQSMQYQALVAEGFDEARRITMAYLTQSWRVLDRWKN